MRRTIATLIALLALLQPTTAQGQRFVAGPCIGLAASQVDGDSYAGYHKAGPIAGLWVEYHTQSAWSAMAKFRYLQKGCRARGEAPGSTKFALQLNYLDLQLTAIYRLNQRMSLVAGLSGGYLTSLREFNIGGEVPREHTIGLRRYELAATAGAHIHLGPRLRAEAAFSYSIIPLMPIAHTIEHWRNKGARNNVIEISLLYEL
ncbi:MAG: PorT family protein [Bacteroidales bacterium]|nr:PorT family protein [Bacteroidales bacterium]